MREWLTLSRHDRSRADALWRRTHEIAGRGPRGTWATFELALASLGKVRFQGSASALGWFSDGKHSRSPIADALFLSSPTA